MGTAYPETLHFYRSRPRLALAMLLLAGLIAVGLGPWWTAFRPAWAAALPPVLLNTLALGIAGVGVVGLGQLSRQWFGPPVVLTFDVRGVHDARTGTGAAWDDVVGVQRASLNGVGVLYLTLRPSDARPASVRDWLALRLFGAPTLAISFVGLTPAPWMAESYASTALRQPDGGPEWPPGDPPRD